MTILGSSDIIAGVDQRSYQGNTAQTLHFRDGKVLLINAHGMALFQNLAAIEDELGNGLMAQTEFADDLQLPHQDHQWVTEYSAGFVGLHGDYALLITPVAIQLFRNKQDALHNRDELARLNLETFVSH